jgi:hypothetical protein
MDVLRQRQGAGRFNHHTPMGKGQSLAPLVLHVYAAILAGKVSTLSPS